MMFSLTLIATVFFALFCVFAIFALVLLHFIEKPCGLPIDWRDLPLGKPFVIFETIGMFYAVVISEDGREYIFVRLPESLEINPDDVISRVENKRVSYLYTERVPLEEPKISPKNR